jgi:hypothetical protein
MTHRTNRVAALGLWLGTLAGCHDGILGPERPGPDDRVPPPPPPQVGEYPPLAHPAAVLDIYDRASASSIPGTHRFVLYNDSTFRLQFVKPDVGFFEYPGTYSRADSRLSFVFDARQPPGQEWFAQGTLEGESMLVTYNDAMLWADFENGVYLRRTALIRSGPLVGRQGGPDPGGARLGAASGSVLWPAGIKVSGDSLTAGRGTLRVR